MGVGIYMYAHVGRVSLAVALTLAVSSHVLARQADDQGHESAGPSQPPGHQHMHMHAEAEGWQFMQDGVLFGVFNHQGGPRGGDEFKAPNWWMGTLTRHVGSSQLTLNAMFSLDPATAGKLGYGELFQVGEAVDGRPLIDRQHPHDFFMQLAGVWRTPLTDGTGLTIAGGPVGEPALGPVAFMHRASAAEYPLASLGHHTFDSSHIAFGVITAAVDHGPWVVEASVFNGREPDQNRWNFDFGALDSVSARVWYRPGEQWELQVSTGHLVQPEELEPGNIQRTTASASWFTRQGEDFTAVTVGYGVNATRATNRQALFGEATRHSGPNSVFGRVDVVELETDLLVNDAVPPTHDHGDRKDIVGALTAGAVRDIVRWRGFEGGIGAAATLYAVPDALKVTHGNHPVSFQVFFRLRPPVSRMGRMWNMRMSQPMAGHMPEP
jgi:hypothetical protein